MSEVLGEGFKVSVHIINKIPILPDEVRDWKFIDEGAAAFNMDTWNSNRVVGLDWHVWNDGAGPLNVTIDGLVISVPINQDIGMNNTKFAIFQVSAVQHRLVLAGIKKGVKM